MFPGIELISMIYLRYCRRSWETEHAQSSTTGVDKIENWTNTCHGRWNTFSLALQEWPKLYLGHLEHHGKWNTSSTTLQVLTKLNLRPVECHWERNTSSFKLFMWVRLILGQLECHERWNTSSIKL